MHLAAGKRCNFPLGETKYSLHWSNNAEANVTKMKRKRGRLKYPAIIQNIWIKPQSNKQTITKHNSSVLSLAQKPTENKPHKTGNCKESRVLVKIITTLFDGRKHGKENLTTCWPSECKFIVKPSLRWSYINTVFFFTFKITSTAFDAVSLVTCHCLK